MSFSLFLAQQPNTGQGRLILRFLDHTQWHTAVGKIPLDEGSARRRETSTWKHNTHKDTHPRILLYFIRTCVFVLVGIWSLLTIQTSMRPGGIICTLSVLLCPHCPGFAFCPYCTSHTTQNSMPPAGFEPTIPASDRPQILTLDRSANGIGWEWV